MYVETMEACTRIPWNGVKMETIAPRNDHATEWNINFLLTTTVKKTGPNHILCSETLRRVLELAETGNNILNVVGFWGVARLRGNK